MCRAGSSHTWPRRAKRHPREHDRNYGGRLFDGDARWGCPSDDHIHLQADELGRDLSEALVASLRPPILNGDGAALNPTEVAQSLDEGGKALAIDGSRTGSEISDGRQFCWLLRARR
jgi:hypothetical protein